MSTRSARLATLLCRYTRTDLQHRAALRPHKLRWANSVYCSDSRHYSVWLTLQPGEVGYGLWTPHVLGMLLALGVGLTTWNSLNSSPSLSMWPPEVRNDVRLGIRAKERGDWNRCRRHISRAYQTLVSLPLQSVSPDLFLKTSGLLILLADALEQSGNYMQAYDTYMLAVVTANSEVTLFPDAIIRHCLKKAELLDYVPADSALRSPPPATPMHRIEVEPTLHNRLRLTSILLKLSDMALSCKIDAVEEHRILLLAIKLAKNIVDEIDGAEGSPARSLDKVSSLSADIEHDDLELPLPVWAKDFSVRESSNLDVTKVAAPYHILANLYARMGLIELAILNYHHVTKLFNVLGGKDDSSKIINTCKVAQTKCNIAETLLGLNEQLQHKEISPSSRFPPLPDIASEMDLPDTSLNINGQPLTPDNVLAHAFMFAKEAFDESCEISFIAQSGMDSQGAIRDSENYGLCANVMMESMRQTTKIIELFGNKDSAKICYNNLLNLAKIYSFTDYMAIAKEELLKLEDEDRMKGKRRVGKVRADLEYDRVD